MSRVVAFSGLLFVVFTVLCALMALIASPPFTYMVGVYWVFVAAGSVISVIKGVNSDDV